MDAVDVTWLDPVLPDPVVEVFGPDGQPVAGLEPAALVARDQAQVRFDPLVEAGTYQVDYVYTSTDGHAQQGAHTFRFTPGDADDGAGIEPRTVMAVAVGLVVVGLAGYALAGRALQTR